MKFLLILLLVLPLSLAAPGEDGSKSEDLIQKAVARHGEHVRRVLKMTKYNKSINGVLRPLSFLNFGATGFIFKGKTLADDKPVAIKFIGKNRTYKAKREYEMYSYLDAINNTEVEKYGIPTVYYYGQWEGLIVTAYTQLEKTLLDQIASNAGRYCNYDILLLIRQFIKQSKYIHSRGVRHDDIKLDNIATRGCESFLFDFDLSSKMSEDNGETTYSFAPLRYHKEVNRVATDDWESFLYTICYFGGITFDWFKDLTNGKKIDKEAVLQSYVELKSKRQRILAIIDQSQQVYFKPIIRAFAEEVFSNKPQPDYDHFYRLVTDALVQNFPTVTCFSWIPKPIRNENEIGVSIERANTNISDLVIPKDFNEYEIFDYPDVDEEFFLSPNLAGSGEGRSKSGDPIQKAIERHGKHVNMVLKMAKNGKSINGVLRPLRLLSSGGAGFIVKGKRLADDAPVAIKFISENSSRQARTEYEMYSYLNAINSTEVEKYGIPTVYYYGHWKGFIVTAYTELEKTLTDHKNSVAYFYYDILLLMRQFIKQSKYIHSRGVRHNDIKPDNIATRGCESFLIDFDLSSKMQTDNCGRTNSFASLKYHQGVKRVAKDDWESFLYTICYIAGITLDWFKKDLINGTKTETEVMKLYRDSKANRTRIFEVIDQSQMRIVTPMIRAFAEEVFSDKPQPDYDRFHKLVTDALAQHFPRFTCFSWIPMQVRDRNKLKESIKRANTNISDLSIPKDFSEYKFFNYPHVNEEFFENMGSK